MEDIVLLDVIERYLTGQMPAEEKAWFKQLREKTPEIDQMVVEHKLFLHQMDEFAGNNALKHSIAAAHNALLQKGDINEGGEKTTKGRVIQLFHKYKKVTAIAASIAGITALGISILVSYFSPSVNKIAIEQLNNKIDRFAKVTNARINEVDGKIPKGVVSTTTGTAFLIDGKGYLITNAHVLNGSSAAVVSNSKGEAFATRIIAIDTKRDIAILKINDKDYKPIPNLPYSIKKTDVDLGEELFTLGYPSDAINYSLGYLSAEFGYQGDTTSCQITLSANPGNSGSPIFNKNGDVVGILSSKQTKAEGIVYAVKTRGIYQMIEELKQNDTSIQKIKLSLNSTLKGEPRTDQIKRVKDYIFQVDAYNP